MSFDLEKLQAVAELGEVIRLQNEALERLQTFRKARPYLMMPNLAKMVEENIKENVQVLYKELNNLHKPSEQQVRYICDECKMAFLTRLPGGLCDECRARAAGSHQPRAYVANQSIADDEDIQLEAETITSDVQETDGETPAEKAASDVAEDLSPASPELVEDNIEKAAEEASGEPQSEDEENVYEISMEADDGVLTDEPLEENPLAEGEDQETLPPGSDR